MALWYVAGDWRARLCLISGYGPYHGVLILYHGHYYALDYINAIEPKSGSDRTGGGVVKDNRILCISSEGTVLGTSVSLSQRPKYTAPSPKIGSRRYPLRKTSASLSRSALLL